MAIEVKVPAVGESVSEGRIARWLKPDGAPVTADEPLFELETDKASQEIPAPVAGVLTIKVKEGEVVKIGDVVAAIDPNGKPTAPANTAREGGNNVTPAKTTAPENPAHKGGRDVIPTVTPGLVSGVRVSPAARQIAADNDLDPAKIHATGPNGVISKEDAVRASAARPSVDIHKPTARTGPRESRQPMTMIRRRIAERLLESQNATATLTTFNEADMSAVMDLRAKVNDRFEKKYGVKLGFMSVFVKAAVEALKAFPLVNARIDGNDVVMQNFYDVGVAVSTEKGLMVPVIRDVDALGFAEIEKAIGEVAKKARDGKIGVADLQGGTFTITNGGIFGSMLSTPILNPPQAAILGMHSIQKRPVAINDQVVIRPMMYLALSYDHRLIDGREAVQFLVRIKECVENPGRMLFDV
ncbi:MAG TPA: 2-oxoglutarate dehydrogenase complex dihydrolipoyllysine-residue succinyltransferase [Fimbriiglobus sp.]|jgi:2-oxoglutarate dehydrogenase E2 component (dihydrolipoamide succinyltransferase)